MHGSSRPGWSTCSSDAEALRCFRFMNQVMADQRVQSQVAGAAPLQPGESHRRAPEATVLAEGPKRAFLAARSSSRSF